MVNTSGLFIFISYYTQSPAFPELFQRLVASPIMKKIDDETGNKEEKDRIYKQDWKPRVKTLFTFASVCTIRRIFERAIL
jgi:hypothetical protein